MKTRHAASGPDPVTAAHLTGASRPTPPIYRHPAPPDLGELVGWFWIPVWSVPPGEVHRQAVLQHPTCQLVVASAYARLYGVVRALSTVELEGDGWAVGTALRPGAGRQLLGRSVAGLTDGHVDLVDVPGLGGEALIERVHAAMVVDPHAPAAQRAATEAISAVLRGHLPLDDDGRRVNAMVDLVRQDRSLTRVAQLAAALGWSERTVQRLCRERLGLSPKWLLQRRRLHEASAAMKTGRVDLAGLAADLGYVDQAHFTNDWTRVTGSPPGAYAADQPPRAPSLPRPR